MLGMPPLGENRGSASPRRVQGKQTGQELLPQAGGSPGNHLPTPQDERLWWGGSGQGPLGSLAGSRGTGPVVGSQGRFWVAEVPPSSGPHPQSLTSTGLESRPLASTLQGPAQSQWVQRPDGVQSPSPHEGLPRLYELGPAQPAPKMTRESVPQCPRGTSFLRRLPSAVGEAGREGGSVDKLPWPWTSFSRLRVGEEERAYSLEGLGAPGRQEEGMGRPWLGSQAWRGQPSGGVS